ncbi:ABC transporter permease [Streptomyces racemochromogenes]|uniref:ABC transporter permease n=1 Tax=Streptomyces racemochromogenes TaxID=67353 RepID=A0ABW7PFD8_9ACTN
MTTPPALRLTVLGGIMSYRALFNWATPAMFVGTLFGAPLVQMLFFVYLGRQLQLGDDRFYVIGNALLAASVACVYGGTMAIANERRYGTLGAVLLSPRSRTLLWAGRALPYIANGILVTVVNLTAGNLLLGLGLTAGDQAALAPLILTAAVSCSGFGLLLGAIGLRLRDVFLIANVVFVLLLLLSGANVSRSVLPEWMRLAGDALPLTHAITGARSALTGAGTELLPSLAAEAGIGLCYLLAAVFLLHHFERSSRRRATLDTM